MRTIASLLLLVVALSITCTACRAQAIFSPMHTLVLPLPPGERGISRMQMQPDGGVYGFVPTPEKQWHFFRISPSVIGGVAMVTAVPDLVLPPAEVMNHLELPWQWDDERKQGYALTEKGHLLAYRANGDTTDLGQVAGTRPFEDKTGGYQLSHTILVMPTGDVYTAGENGTLFKYVPGTGAVTKLPVRLPAVAGREPWASLDAAVIGPDGLIYGGTFDGYLFTFNPQTMAIANLGKPLRAQRITTLIFRTGILYGIGGDDESIPRVFSFDPATGGFTPGGLFINGLTEKFLNYYEPVGACATDAAGNIYVSTAGRLGNLYVWNAPVEVK